MISNYFNTNNILIPFTFIIDIDIGIIRYIKNNIMPNDEFFNKNSDDIIKGKLLNRVFYNPLSILFDTNKYDIESLYKELLDIHYKEILSLSDRTDIINLLLSTKKSENINIFIWCKNDIEKEYILKKLDNRLLRYTIIGGSEIPNFKETIINSIFFENTQDLYKMSEYCKNMQIYLGYYKFNMEYINGQITLPSGIEEFIEPEKIRYIQKYIYNKKYFQKEEM